MFAWLVGRLVAHGFAGIRAVDVFVATGDPAGAVLQASAVIFATGENRAVTRDCRVFKMALEAEIGITLDEHLLVYRAVRVMADSASFDHGVMLEEEWALLGGMALCARLVGGFELGRACAGHDVALVRIVAFGAGHLAGHDWVAVRQTELAALIEMALETGFG